MEILIPTPADIAELARQEGLTAGVSRSLLDLSFELERVRFGGSKRRARKIAAGLINVQWQHNPELIALLWNLGVPGSPKKRSKI